jgi:hypothetical protein
VAPDCRVATGGLTVWHARADTNSVTSRRLTAAVVALLVLTVPSGAGAQSDQSRVMGMVTDASGGALPGATVTLRGAGAPPVVMVTDGEGRYLTPWVAPGTYAITFALSGFETRSVNGLALGQGKTVVLDQQLALAALSEVVEVKAPAPPPPPPPPPPLPPVEWPAPKRVQAIPVDKEILASVCGPRLPPAYSLAVGQVIAHRDSGRHLLGPGDLLRINAGTEHGIADGQNLVVRRRFVDGDSFDHRKPVAIGEQTAGLVQIVEIEAKSSVALVVYACSEIIAGDSVEKYAAQPAFFAVSDGTPRFEEPARITFGEHGQKAGAPGQMMVIDRGIMQGAARGQRLTIFRREPRRNLKIGDGVIIAVRADSATIKIERSIDAVTVGDLVALHR